MDLIKRLGIIVGIFVLCLLIRTLVSPPVVIVGRTAENLKAFLCQSDWWDHSFTILEFLFLLWGIRLCIMVRKAPSEFNESRFISMTIYNEFLLSIFLNVSMFFLQHPANPDLLYIIFFCHSQLTITILLCLIFASKFYLVVKGHGKPDEGTLSKNGPGKFLASKVRAAHASLSQQSNPTIGQVSSLCTDGILSEKDIQLELDKIFQTLSILKDKNSHGASHAVTSRISSIQEAFKDTERSSRINGDGLRQSSLPQGDIRNRDEPLATRHDEKRSGNTTFGGFGGALVVAETAALAAATLSSQGARVPKATIEEEPENCSQTEVESSRNCSGVSKLPLQICLDEAKVDPKTLVVEKEPKIDKLTLESQKIIDSVVNLPKCDNPCPHSHSGSCQSSQSFISSDCSHCCNPICSFDSVSNPSYCSLGSDCSYQLQGRVRSQTQAVPIDLVHSSVSLPDQESDRDPFEICQNGSNLYAQKGTSNIPPYLFASSGHLDREFTKPEQVICFKPSPHSLDDTYDSNYLKSKTSSVNPDHHDTRSGHERTHRIIINLDDKNRFTDEVTV